MQCSNCGAEVKEGSRYCGNCGMNFVLTTVAWLLRRTLAGALAGLIGWIFCFYLFNSINLEISETATVLLRTVVSSAFIGIVIGVLEKSTGKIIAGIFGGILGGLIGALISLLILKNEILMWLYLPEKATQLEFSLYTTASSVIWLVAGAFIGLFTAQRKKGISAFIAGALGGAIGGAVGWELFLRLRYEATTTLMFLISDAFSGAIIAGLIFLFLGLAERFTQSSDEKIAEEETVMICAICNKETPVSGYCINCGNILKAPQIANPRRYGALYRISNVFRFLARFVLIVGLLTAVGYFVILLTKSIFNSLLAMVGIAVISYVIFITFNAIAETILLFLDIEKNTRKIG